MATVHPGTATSASAIASPLDSTQAVVCPFCQTLTPCAPVAGVPLHQCPCPSCNENLLILNPDGQPADEDMVTPSSAGGSDATDMSRRLVGLAVALLACVLNYALLAGMASWMFNQIKSTHDPYDIDELTLSPIILKANGWTALHLAAARGDVSEVTSLLEDGSPVDRHNNNGRTALFEAATRGQTPVVTVLLQYGANPNARMKQNVTALLTAAEHGHADTIAVLLSNGADLNALCTCGDSALHRAVRKGHLAAAQVLLEQGIAANQKSHGETALEIAQHDEDRELIELLRAHGGREFSQAKAHRAQGVAFQKKGQVDKALFAYAEALNLDPDDPEAYFDRGTALLEKDSPDEALIAFQAAIRLNSTFIEAYSAAASVHIARRQWDQALALWDRFLALRPQDGRAHFERAIVRRAKGDSKGFLQELQQACTFGHRAAC
ncbi:MAG TPA: ankyrin repeat domain-containing protein [Nitrospira sp.]|nr:ankyrin repeat domain-containing protein [Nitrospira sp.]